MIFRKFYLMCKLREVFTVLKMNITIEAIQSMSKGQLYTMKGPNMKVQFKRAY